MAATGTPTPNIGLRIPVGTDPASVDDINYNSNLIDTKLGPVGSDSVQDQIDTLNSNLIPSISQCSTDIYTTHKTVPINRLIKVGKLVFIQLIMIADSGYSFTTDTSFILPSGYRPSAETRIPVVVKKNNVYSSADGAVDSLGNGWQSYSSSADEIHINTCFVAV